MQVERNSFSIIMPQVMFIVSKRKFSLVDTAGIRI